MFSLAKSKLTYITYICECWGTEEGKPHAYKFIRDNNFKQVGEADTRWAHSDECLTCPSRETCEGICWCTTYVWESM